MLCIYNTNTDPYFNLAAEEYLLNSFQDDIFMLWRNGPSIIVGKNQNTYAEINVDYVKHHQIRVVRRLSGGGAVFHDLGNINFTFIMGCNDHKEIHFEKYTRPILGVLHRLGIEARFEGRNDLTIDGKKFSGNAEYINQNRILHHGTLLFSAQMTDLTQALKVNPLKYKDKSVKSVRSRVTNISDHLSQALEMTDFIDMLMAHIVQKYPDAVPYSFSQEDRQKIAVLAESKYATWGWNFGASRKYSFSHMARTAGGNIEILLDVNRGVIKGAKIFGDFFGKLDVADLEQALVDTPHDRAEIEKKLKMYRIEDYLANVSLDEFLEVIF
jgi:lipoate-protein ligase A